MKEIHSLLLDSSNSTYLKIILTIPELAMSSTTVTETSHQAEPAEDNTAAMLRAAEANHTKPLWLQMTRLNPPLPNPRCTPHLWKYSEIQPTLLQAGQLVTEKQAERRVLMLVNPSRGTQLVSMEL